MNAKFIPFFPQKFNSKARNWLMIPRGMLLAKLSDTSGYLPDRGRIPQVQPCRRAKGAQSCLVITLPGSPAL
jgi:hypothetical protein